MPGLSLLGPRQCGSFKGSFQFDFSVILVVLGIIVTGYNISVLGFATTKSDAATKHKAERNTEKRQSTKM